jgi:hypothetical protein
MLTADIGNFMDEYFVALELLEKLPNNYIKRVDIL